MTLFIHLGIEADYQAEKGPSIQSFSLWLSYGMKQEVFSISQLVKQEVK
jgi:hypothetical protein